MGSIYKRGNIFWLKYFKDGKPYYESTKSRKETVAKRLLKLREGEIAEGKLPGVFFDRVKFDGLAEDLITDYEFNNRKSIKRVRVSLAHLETHFKGVKIPQITTPKIQKYIKHRLGEGAANATINRELSALKRLLNLGARQTPPKVDRVPHIPMLKEDNARQGFFEHHEYLNLLKELPVHVRPLVTFAYNTGWRKGEILNLEWRNVDFRERTVCLRPEETKNGHGRVIYMDDGLLKMLKIQNLKRQKDCPYIFHNAGSQIKDFRGAWKTACNRVDITGKLFHDLRRTAVRNMVRSGIQERVAMKISGHMTREVFDRYNIVSSEDLKQAAVKIEAYHETVTNTVTVGKNARSRQNDIHPQVVGFKG